jgi:TPP-dependent pyruvate/acetoin dehydrogenase alpha subunit
MDRITAPNIASEAEEEAAQADYQGIDIEQWLHIYEQMLKIRHFEETVNELYKSARMPGLAHLYSGEEAVAVGVCENLRRDDYITSTHRGHGHCLAKGASVDRMFAELLGKAPGYCKGKGGSMHIADPETGNLGANAIVAGGGGIATGAAFSSKMRKSGQVAACFFGDGALGQGVLYEVMNMAALWKLPVLYVCENNLYTEYTFYREVMAGSPKARPEAFGILTEEVDGQDVRRVYTAAARLVEHARRGDGPGFLICNTYRYHGHHVGDINRAYYRAKEEEELWKETHDPIKMLAGWLRTSRGVQVAILNGIEEQVEKEIADGVAFAEAAPYPEPSEVNEDVYA